MGKITRLDEHISNLIAAGEVIERASSVVKELVENSIDAKASTIVITLVDAGLKEITVSDNGIGMDQQDARICFEPHCTSKIKNANDLFNINTLGFRGEALPSIVAVSNFKLKTSTEGGRGIMYSLKGGQLVTEAVVSCPKGTEISVRNLFFNTPARLQNLQSANVELSYIVDYVQKEALAHSEVAFKLINNDRVIFQTYGSGNQLEVLTAMYGNEIGKDLRDIFNNNGYYKIQGYISKINQTRSNKNHIHIMINGRLIKNASIVRSVLNGYDTYLMVGRYPVCLINITCDPALVDVNVHPSKLEVRFSNENELLEMITGTIKDALKNTSMLMEEAHPYQILEEESSDVVEEDTVEDANEDDSTIELDNEENLVEEITEDDETNHEELTEDDKTNHEELNEFEMLNRITNVQNNHYDKVILDEDDDFSFDDLKLEAKEAVEVVEPIVEQKPIIVATPKKDTFVQQEYNLVDDNIKENKKLPKLTYLTQLFGTYLICQDDDNMYLIDQHAANERVNYEKISKELGKTNVISYELLVPIKIDFSVSESLLINEKMEKINELGIKIEEFGTNTYTVREVPIWLFKGQEKEFVEEIISQIINNNKSSKQEFLDSLAKSLACKKSIKANSYISQLEVDYLLDNLGKCNNPFTCPHGRPIIVKYTKYEIEKWFKRVV